MVYVWTQCVQWIAIADAPVHIFMAVTEFLKAIYEVSIYELSSISIVLCILIVFRYIFSGFTTSTELAIRTFSLLWSSLLSCSVALLSHWRTKRVCYCSEMVRLWHCTNCVHIYTIYGEASAHLYGEGQSF